MRQSAVQDLIRGLLGARSPRPIWVGFPELFEGHSDEKEGALEGTRVEDWARTTISSMPLIQEFVSRAEPLFPKDPPKEVLILGAGFSMALSNVFPNTDALGSQAAAMASRSINVLGLDRKCHNGNFEAWLSRIAEP